MIKTFFAGIGLILFVSSTQAAAPSGAEITPSEIVALMCQDEAITGGAEFIYFAKCLERGAHHLGQVELEEKLSQKNYEDLWIKYLDQYSIQGPDERQKARVRANQDFLKLFSENNPKPGK